jgi:hypothetical protein
MRTKNRHDGFAGRFIRDARGMAAMDTALWFGAVGLALAVFAAPLLDHAVQTYAQNRSFGIDRTLTGSVDGGGDRYTIRRSVLTEEPQILCRASSPNCPTR